MKLWLLNFRKGMKKLTRHETECALRYLQTAIAGCPVDRSTDLAKILFYTGIALKKLGLHDGAVRSWNASHQLVKNGPVVRHLKRFSNEYGMAKQGMEELDDWKAFYSIQLARYLRSKKSRCIGTVAESDMIRDLISDAWNELKRSGTLAGMSPAEKIGVFKSVSIVFPFFYVPGVRQTSGESVGRDSKSCPCGSGLPFRACCGNRDRGIRISGGIF